MEHGYGVLVEMDADGSPTSPRSCPSADPLKGADLVSARAGCGRAGRELAQVREFISARGGGSQYSRVLLDVPIRDVTAATGPSAARPWEGLGLTEVASQGYCFQVDLARRRKAAFTSSRSRSLRRAGARRLQDEPGHLIEPCGGSPTWAGGGGSRGRGSGRITGAKSL